MFYISLPLDSREKLEKEYESFRPAFERIKDLVVRDIRKGAAEMDLSVTVRHRVKSFESWYSKALRGAASAKNTEAGFKVTDVLGIRVVCPFLQEVEQVSDLIRSLFEVNEFEIKGADYPAQQFGYESVHFLILIPEDLIDEETLPADFTANPVCEVQVRTILQEAWAEVEHELIYKSDFTPLDEPLKRKLAALNANLTLSDIMFQEIRDYQKDLHTALRQRRKDFYARLRVDEPAPPAAPQNRSPELGTRETVDSLLLKGLLAHNDGRFDEAVLIYTRILEKDIRKDIRSVILTHRGMAFFSGGMLSHALEDFNKAIDLNPAYAKARYYRAVHARTEGRYDDAFTDMEKCLRNEPFNPEFITARAETHASAGDLKAAEKDCKDVLKIEPSFKPALRLLDELTG